MSLLEPFRGKVPDEVFGDPYIPPVSDGSGQDRALLRKAGARLQEAGFLDDADHANPPVSRSPVRGARANTDWKATSNS